MLLKKNFKKLIIFCGMMGISLISAAEVVTIKPLYDIVVRTSLTNGTVNYADASRFTSGAGTSPNSGINSVSSEMYEKFLLPAYVEGSSISSAEFKFSYSSIIASSWQPLAIYGVSKNWTGSDIYGMYAYQGPKLALVPQGQNMHAVIDLTDYVNSAYQKGQTWVSFAIATQYGVGYGDDAIAILPEKTLNLSLVSAVPEPSTYAMMLLGLGLLGFTIRRQGKMNRHKTPKQ